MWYHFALLFLAGTALAEDLALDRQLLQADRTTIWKQGQTYQYLVRSRTFAGVSKLSQQLAGVKIKGQLDVHVVQPDTLVVEFHNAKFAQLHTTLEKGWDSHVPEKTLKFVDLPATRPYKVQVFEGKIKEVLAHPDVPVWQVNMMKGILSQLQFNTDKSQEKYEIPQENNDMFKTYTMKEHSVTGNCKITYDILPLSKKKAEKIPIVPLEQLKGNQYLDVMKTRDYNDCSQLPMYQVSVTKETGKGLHNSHLVRSSKTDMIVSHNQEGYAIRSSVTKNIVQVRQKVNNMDNMEIMTVVNLTLVEFKPQANNMQIPTNVVSAGNLTYIYANDFNGAWAEPELLNLELNLDSKSTSSSSESQEMAHQTWSSERRDRNVRSLRYRNIQDSGEQEFGDNIRNVQDSRERELGQNVRNVQDSRERKFGHNVRNVQDSREREFGYNLRKVQDSREQEFGYLARKPTLQQKLSPWAMGYSGQQAVDANKMIQISNKLINEIATELTKHEEILEQNTLEKFTILINKLRHLNEKEIADVERNLGNSKWSQKVFQDAIAQAGTGPAFLKIREWVMSGKVKGLRAADLISRIPIAVREPTAEYIEAFFELITSQQVKNEPFLSNTAPFAFSELARYVLVRNHKYFYPVRTYGALVKDEDKKKLTDKYIPYFAKELKKAFDEKEDSKVITYIITLGNMANKRIIPIFEPYLEGKYSTTKLQRTLMVDAMKRLADMKPELVRPIVYKIYQNDLENYQVRTAAVQVLLRTRPPLHIMQRMAQKTNFEPNPEVNNVVVSGIMSIAELQLEEQQDVARNARKVVKLLNPAVKPTKKFSFNNIQDFVSEKKDMSAWFNLNTIDNKISMLPNLFNLRVGANYSYSCGRDYNVMFAATDMSDIEQMIKQMFLPENKFAPVKSTVDELASKLKILLDKKEAIEGGFVLNDAYRVFLIAFDQRNIKHLLQDILGNKDSNKNELLNVNMNSLVNWETTIRMPSEMGLLIHHNLNSVVLTVQQSKVQTKKQDQNQQNLKTHIETDTVLSKKVMHRLSFTTPFDGKRYVTGVDTAKQLHVPAIITLQLEPKTSMLNIVLEPLPGNARTKWWHSSVVPFTSITEVPNNIPMRADKQTQQNHVGTVKKQQKDLGMIEIIREADVLWPVKSNSYAPSRNGQAFQKIMSFFNSKNVLYKKTEVISQRKQSNDNKIIVSLNYNRINDKNLMKLEVDKLENLSNLLKDERQQDKNQNNQPLSAVGGAIQLKIPSQNIDYQCNVGRIDFASGFMSKLHGDCHSKGAQPVFKIYGAAMMYKAPSNSPSADLGNGHSKMLVAKIKYGDSRENEKSVMIGATQEQSRQVQEQIKNSEEYQLCQEEKKQGKYGLKNCRQLGKYIDMKDELWVNVKADQKELNTVYNKAAKVLENIIPDMKIQFMQTMEKDSASKLGSINLKINKPFHSEIWNVTFSVPPLKIQAPLDTSALPFRVKQWINKTLGIKENNVCTVGNNKVLTFDGMEYNVKFSKCPVALMVSPTPMEQDANWDIAKKLMPKQANVAVMVKDSQNGQRQLIVLWNNQVYKIEVSNNKQILVNQKPVEFEGDRALFKSQEKPEGFEIVSLPSQIYKITFKSVGVKIYFDGKNVQIKASDRYHALLRGLCGDKDNIKDNDWKAPRGCILKNSEHMSALYTSVDNECPNIAEKQREAEQAECVKEEYQQTNVVSDIQAGRVNPYKILMTRPRQQCYVLRTDVIQEEERICFSVRPVEKCAPSCEPEKQITKKMPYHCQPISRESLDLKDRIEKGAVPDFSRRSVSFFRDLMVPTGCRRV